MASSFRPSRVVCSFQMQPEGVAALDRAAQLARTFDAMLMVVMAGAVISPLPEVTDVVGMPEEPVGGAVEAVEAGYRDEHAAAQARLAEWGVEAEFLRSEGDAESIVEIAETHKADLIVIGAHDSGTLQRLFTPDTAGAVSRQAACDVLVVHASHDAPRSTEQRRLP